MKFKSSYNFLVYYFFNIMEICFDGANWTPPERVKEMRGLIEVYKDNFKLHNYRDLQVWKRIKKLYWRNWDTLHYDATIFDKTFYNNGNK